MLDRLIRIEKNIVEYYREDYTIETRYEFNDKGQIIKKLIIILIVKLFIVFKNLMKKIEHQKQHF
ncbi:hypothetical protein [Candidatus Phytoplasma sp. AldY-WA1]|uniref:hypothetical protein n=1 Tax=Candidatus Phytoplasma sp. AldY-WA1 TaxID=2852100 RepID=UPI00254D31E9|nr:hypothetical protein [Candidatus Phytoplasma sp. AldY-WA1]